MILLFAAGASGFIYWTVIVGGIVFFVCFVGALIKGVIDEHNRAMNTEDKK